MTTTTPKFVATTLGKIRHGLGLVVIGFGVFMGGLMACIIALSLFAAYFDTGVLSETTRWTLAGSVFSVSIGLTYCCRGWIVRKAIAEASPDPVQLWSGKDVTNAGLAVTRQVADLAVGLLSLAVGLLSLGIVAIVGGALLYGGYLLLTIMSVPVAILIGAIIIALAVLAAAFAR